MRDYIIAAIIFAAAPLCLINPYFGVLMWSWTSYFNPHRYGWGFAYHLPVAMIVGIPTLIGAMLFRRGANRYFFVRETFLLLLLCVWFAVTSINGLHTPEFAPHYPDLEAKLVEVSKIMLMTFVTMWMVSTPKKLKYLVLVTAFSLGIRAIFGAIFGLQTGGEFRVYGPRDSFLEDNNYFGLALNMTVPMLFYLARAEKGKTLRIFLWAGMVSAIISSLLTYSRGALLGLIAVAVCIILKSKHKIVSIAAVAILVPMFLVFVPDKWEQRMTGTFVEHKLDSSAQQRLVSWGMAWNFVHDYPIFGGGFQVFEDIPLYQKYEPEALTGGFLSSGPHSVYFQMLGDQGFVGIGIFLVLVGSCWVSLRVMRIRAKHDPSADWALTYSHMFEASLLAFITSGAFLGVAYFDFFYQLIAMIVVAKSVYKAHRIQLLNHASSDSDTEHLEHPAAGELSPA